MDKIGFPKALSQKLWAHNLEVFCREPAFFYSEIQPERPKVYFVQRGSFTVSRLIHALQDLQATTGDVPIKVQQESDWDREWEPVEEIEFERDGDGKIVALRLA